MTAPITPPPLPPLPPRPMTRRETMKALRDHRVALVAMPEGTFAPPTVVPVEVFQSLAGTTPETPVPTEAPAAPEAPTTVEAALDAAQASLQVAVELASPEQAQAVADLQAAVVELAAEVPVSTSEPTAPVEAPSE